VKASGLLGLEAPLGSVDLRSFTDPVAYFTTQKDPARIPCRLPGNPRLILPPVAGVPHRGNVVRQPKLALRQNFAD